MDFKEYQEKASTTAMYPTIVDMVLNELKTIKDNDIEDDIVIENISDLLKRKSYIDHNIYYASLGLAGEAGEVANKVKKIMRDSNGVITDEMRNKLKGEVGDVLWYISAVCCELDIDMNDVAEANIEKLFSRKERGVISGNGDNR